MNYLANHIFISGVFKNKQNILFFFPLNNVLDNLRREVVEVHRYWLRLPVRSLTPSRLPKIRLGDILFGIAANHLREDHTKYMHRTAIQTHYLQHQIRNPPAHRHSRIYMTVSSTCFGNKFTALETQEHERGKVSVFFRVA